HAATGATFLEYLHNICLAEVHKMLIGTDLPLSEIASKTGFTSTAQLTRVFKQVYDVAPRDFRKRNGE
ncbi:MAG: helix-turn-helix transcriptional regulator, partial [Lachnospiraceae bacterium]|nr:helix-turn-helix transcriptional regulator [Lachnospiraceae bacterium]